jgi:hypothetical protein
MVHIWWLSSELSYLVSHCRVLHVIPSFQFSVSVLLVVLRIVYIALLLFRTI